MNAKKMFARKLNQTRAQAMTEYIIIVSLVAIGCISVVTAFGSRIASLFKRATKSLGTGSVVKLEKGNADQADYQGLDAGDGGIGGAAGAAAGGAAGGALGGLGR